IRRVEAVTAEVLNDTELKRPDAPVLVDGSACPRGVLARVTGRDQVLGAVLAPAHWSFERTSERRDRELLAVDGDLQAKGAADVRADHRDLGFGKPHPARELRAERMWHLIADVHGKVLRAGVPHRAAAARFNRRVGLTVLVEACFDNQRGLREPAHWIAGGEG